MSSKTQFLVERLKQMLLRHTILTKICGGILIILGIIGMIAPILPGIWLVVIGLEMIGVHLLFIDRIKTWTKSMRTGWIPNQVQNWHALPLEVVHAKLKTIPDVGLSDLEAEKRLGVYGLNQLVAAKQSSALKLLLRQFKNVFILILLIAILLSVILGHDVEAVAMTVLVLFATILGFIQEWRAEHTLEALRALVAPLALVVRGGVEREISTQELVPGDIVLLSTGDRVPADGRLVNAINLKTDESALTGESVSAEKDAAALCTVKAPVGDRRNMVFAGTSVTYGRGRVLVVATGMQTEFGQIAGLLQNVQREDTPLQKNLDHIGKMLTVGALILVFIVGLLGVVRGQPILEALVFAIALAVAVVPEALPAVVTISLAIGVQRMSKRHALIRYLPAVETLGCTTYICSDKTGTLTKDEMTVRKMYLADGTIVEVTGSGYDPHGAFLFLGAPYTSQNLRQLLQAGALSSDAQLVDVDGVWGLKGDPTEAALVVAAAKAGLQKISLDEQFPRIAEIPFSSEAKRMTTLHQTAEGTVAYGKGAAEVMLSACTHIQTEAGSKPLTEKKRGEMLEAIHQFAQDALRVIGVAYIPVSSLAQAEQNMIFLGFLGMIDPPRPEARAAIQKCREAGIKLMMMTGDHEDTAEAVARELTLLVPGGRVVTGLQLSAMSQEELVREIETISVCARVSPEHKLRVIEALQKRGHVVAMTGDGVNDAPALKRADIGIAMGITGTDVTKEAAVMTLADDNFASIVAAIEEGRIIFGNIKKFLVYLLASNLGEIGLIAVATILGLPLPLTAVQILYVNLASDGLPALALALDPGDGDVMRRPPRNRMKGLFSQSLLAFMLLGGAWVVVAQLGLYVWAITSGRTMGTATTMVFCSLVLMQLINTYVFRSVRKSIFHRPFANRWLNWAVVWEIALLIFIVQAPVLHVALKIVTLSFNDWVIVIGTAATALPILEISKRIFLLARLKN